MRKVSMTLNLLVVVFFVVFLCYTFWAKQHLEGVARNYVTEKTVKHSKPVVEMAAEAMNSPLVTKFLSKKQEEAIIHEIEQYQKTPEAYVADLTRQKKIVPVVKNPNPLLKKVTKVKEAIRNFYDETLAALIEDLRIFSISNLVAALLAFVLAYRSREEIQKSLVAFSLVMFAVVFCFTYMYIDDLTFFHILFRWHMGWNYAFALGIAIFSLYCEYHYKHKQAQVSAKHLEVSGDVTVSQQT